MVVPFLMTMFFGVVKFGIALNNNLALTDGVRASSRQLATSRSTEYSGHRHIGATSAGDAEPDVYIDHDDAERERLGVHERCGM